MTKDSFEAALGRPVVAADTADDLGIVKSFVVDKTGSRIVAIHVAGRGSNAEIVPWASVRAFGADAVVAEGADAREPASSERDVMAAKGQVDAIGSRVLTTAGFSSGEVQNIFFDAGTGALTGVLTDEGEIDIGRVRSLGSYALVVDA